jgi:hypothetical protein
VIAVVHAGMVSQSIWLSNKKNTWNILYLQICNI